MRRPPPIAVFALAAVAIAWAAWSPDVAHAKLSGRSSRVNRPRRAEKPSASKSKRSKGSTKRKSRAKRERERRGPSRAAGAGSGRGNCTGHGAILRPGASQCRRPATRSWCLAPMHDFTYGDVLHGGRWDAALVMGTEAAHSTASFASLLSSRRDRRLLRQRLSHLTLHAKNGPALRVLERGGKFGRAKRKYLLPNDLAKLAKGKRGSRRFDWQSCAVVASSRALLASEDGDLIDRHAAVIRFNRAPTKGFERCGRETSSSHTMHTPTTRHQRAPSVAKTDIGPLPPRTATWAARRRCVW